MVDVENYGVEGRGGEIKPKKKGRRGEQAAILH